MPGFPTRLTRSALGPKFRDVYPVENPETDIGADQFNAALPHTQTYNLIVPRSVLIGAWNAGTAQLDRSHEAQAWNPDKAQSNPTFARAGAGSYSYTFASTYTDETGTAIAISIIAARVTAFRQLTAYTDRVNAYAFIDTLNALKVQIRLYDQAGSGIDAPFWLEVF